MASNQNGAPSFTIDGAEASKKDVPAADIHILDAGHFAMEVKDPEIIELTEEFLKKEHL